MTTVEAQPRHIVVGVDDSLGARAALLFALQEGLERNVTVEVVTTWVLGMPMRVAVTDQILADEAHVVRLRQDQILDEVTREMDEVPRISQLVVHDVGGSPLVDAAKDAAMLVVGSGQHGVLSRLVLGSVSEFCVRHAVVPVVVVPDPSKVAEARAHAAGNPKADAAVRSG